MKVRYIEGFDETVLGHVETIEETSLSGFTFKLTLLGAQEDILLQADKIEVITD